MRETEKAAWSRFTQDIPADLHDDIQKSMFELAHYGGSHPYVTITDVVHHDVLNLSAEGIVTIGDREFSFTIRSGNNNGSELLDWDTGKGIDRTPPVVEVIAPVYSRIAEIRSAADAAALLSEWDDALDPATEIGKNLSGLAGKRAYDRHFAPGTGTSRHWDRKAGERGYEIVEEDVAIDRRKTLLGAVLTVRPTYAKLLKGKGACATLRAWTSLQTTPGDLSERLNGHLAAVIDRLSQGRGTCVLYEEQKVVWKDGYEICDGIQARATKEHLVMRSLRLEPIPGFDRKDLPESMISSFIRGFPHFREDFPEPIRVDPLREGARLVLELASVVSRREGLDIPQSFRDKAAEIGFTIGWIDDMAALTPELQDADLPCP